MGTGSFPGVKRPKRDANHPYPSITRLRIGWSLPPSAAPRCLQTSWGDLDRNIKSKSRNSSVWQRTGFTTGVRISAGAFATTSSLLSNGYRQVFLRGVNKNCSSNSIWRRSKKNHPSAAGRPIVHWCGGSLHPYKSGCTHREFAKYQNMPSSPLKTVRRHTEPKFCLCCTAVVANSSF